jgi:predicted aminopeptidase
MRLVVLLCVLLSSCRVGYVMSSSYYQMELLAKRKKNTRVLKKNKLPPKEAEKLALIPEMKAFGKTLGLAAKKSSGKTPRRSEGRQILPQPIRKIFGLPSTKTYNSISLRWDRTIWNVSGCDPLQFKPASWWFPIVGRVPYLGFFTDKAADRWIAKFKEEGLDTYKRTAGAYSTLGWFRDPILPGMLKWDEYELAEVVFHELAHAALWVKGSVSFNESFANFVGQEAMFLYLGDKFGKDSKELEEARRDFRDQKKFVALLHALYKDVDAVFHEESLSDEAKLKKKQEVYDSIGERILASDMEQKERYAKAVQRNPWNNARLMQFKTYNTSEEDFAAILQQQNGNLNDFIDEIRRITKKQKKPAVAIKAAADKIRAAQPASAPVSQPVTQPASSLSPQ